MSEQSPLGPDERRAAELVRGLPAPSPDADYRARLKREFVAGTIAAPGVAGRISAIREERPRRLSDTLFLPAAAAVLVIAALAFNRGPGWQVLEVHGAGSARINGHAVALADRDRLARALRAGGRIELPAGATMTVTAPGRLAVEITPETEAQLTAPPSRWLGRIASATLASGEIRVTTGERFHGARFDVTTPEARVLVTGTTLAVIREPEGTCVCVMDGTVRVGPLGQPMVAVPAGRRRYIFHDGRPPEQAEMRPIERVKLGEMMEHRPAAAP